VFDGRPLMNIFGPKREEGDWRELRNEQIYEVYSPSSLISVAKSRWVEWTGACEDCESKQYRV
jgi:hypothetical protein